MIVNSMFTTYLLATILGGALLILLTIYVYR